MSYCRWSSDDFKCDLYCYGDVSGGYTTHVAGNRVVGEVPPLPDLDSPKFIEEYKKQSDFMATAKREPIGLPHDGETFNDPDLASFLDRLLELKAIGYHVPDWVVSNIREEMEQEGAGSP